MIIIDFQLYRSTKEPKNRNMTVDLYSRTNTAYVVRQQFLWIKEYNTHLLVIITTLLWIDLFQYLRKSAWNSMFPPVRNQEMLISFISLLAQAISQMVEFVQFKLMTDVSTSVQECYLISIRPDQHSNHHQSWQGTVIPTITNFCQR